MCSDSHITKYEKGTPKISSVSSRRICQTMKVFQNYVKMNVEVLLEVSTNESGYAIPNANRIQIDVHPERYIFQSPI